MTPSRGSLCDGKQRCDVDARLAYGLTAAGAAVLAAFCGIAASRLHREVGPIETPTDYLIISSRGSGERQRMWHATGRVISVAFTDAQYAAAGFAIASAFFVFAATLPADNALSRCLAVLGALLIVFAAVAFAQASRRAALPQARDALDAWYFDWIRSYISAGESPTKQETAEAFMEADPRNAAILKRFKCDPFDR